MLALSKGEPIPPKQEELKRMEEEKKLADQARQKEIDQQAQIKEELNS